MSASYFHMAAMQVEENWNEIYDYNFMFFWSYSVLYCVILLELEINIYFNSASS